jgi:hypothetical protein
LTAEYPVVIVICKLQIVTVRVMETYLDGTGYNTYGTQDQEVGYWILRRDTKL